MGLRYPGGSPEDIANQIINQSDEGIDDLIDGTESYDDDDDYTEDELDFQDVDFGDQDTNDQDDY